uniref:Uncharacterized protein n=1 Tax=Lactuca sativa TaxID=4236 RepID=A0A9R1XY24_LACSA|nr:hypothetical protein LSAT_V11C100001910 [Lactuca sativa]
MSLHKFYKKKEDSEQQHKYTKVHLNSLPVDPFERPSIELFVEINPFRFEREVLECLNCLENPKITRCLQIDEPRERATHAPDQWQHVP